MDFLKVLRAFLVSAYKLTEAEVDLLLTGTDQDESAIISTLLEKDRARIAPLVGKFDQGKNAGKAEALTALENSLKAKFEIESDLKGPELIEHIISTKAQPGKGAELTEDAIKASPIFQKLEQQFKKELKTKEAEFNTAKEQLEQGFRKEQTFTTVADKARGVLESLNPVKPSNPQVAKTWEAKFLEEFKNFDFEIQDGGHIVVKDKEGKVMNDAHGHSLNFEDLVKEKAGNYFEFSANNGGSNAGNGKAGEGAQGSGNDQNKGYPAGVTKPKTFEDLSKVLEDRSIKPEDRAKVLEVWDEEQKTGAQG